MNNNPEFNVRFIQLVELYPQLYNYSLPAYNNKLEIEKAWWGIAETVNETVPNCIAKWTTLRNNFNRSLRENSRSGSKSYYLSEYMQFLLPYLSRKSKKQTGNFDNNEKIECDNKVKEETEENEAFSQMEDCEMEENCLQEEFVTVRTKSEPTNNFRRQGKFKLDDDIMESAYISYIENKKKRKIDSLKNDDLKFFQSLLPLMKNLNNSEKIKFRINVLQTLQQFVEKSDNSNFTNQSINSLSNDQCSLSPCQSSGPNEEHNPNSICNHDDSTNLT